MKKLLTVMMVALGFAAFSQLPYSWVSNVDPGWNSPNGTLVWRPGCTAVTTNCSGQYGNNLNASYISPVIDASCGTSSTIAVSFTAYGILEVGHDFLYFEYSLNDGFTWINPYGASVGFSGNFGSFPGTPTSPVILNATNSIRFRLTFQSDGSGNLAGVKITDFDIACNVVLPVDLISFTGKRTGNENVLSWTTLSEKDNDHFDIEWSVTPEYDVWKKVLQVEAFGDGSSQAEQVYTGIHSNPVIGKKNYYRITQVDKDGKHRTFPDLVAIDNTVKENPVVAVVNLLGQQVNENTPGLLIYIYEDGTKVRKYN